MNPQTQSAHILADRALIDPDVASILKQHGIEDAAHPANREKVIQQIATMRNRDYLNVSGDVSRHDLTHSVATRQRTMIQSLSTLTERAWNSRMASIKQEAINNNVPRDIERARRAIAERDAQAFQASLEAARQNSIEIAEAVREAQNNVRAEIREFLDRSGIGAGEQRTALVDAHTRSMTVPLSLTDMMAAPANLEAEEVRAAQRELEREREATRAPRPHMSAEPSPY